MKDEPNKITATLKVVITGEFYDDEASEETLRYCIEQDLEEAGFEADVSLLKEQEAVKPVKQIEENEWTVCGHCREHLISKWMFCPYCGRAVKWND